MEDKPLGSTADDNGMFNFSFWIENIPAKDLKHILEKTIIESGHTIRGYIEEQFIPYGETFVFILGESHCAIHENAKCTYIEISSCNFEKSEKFIKLIKESPIKIIKEFKFDKSL